MADRSDRGLCRASRGEFIEQVYACQRVPEWQVSTVRVSGWTSRMRNADSGMLDWISASRPIRDPKSPIPNRLAHPPTRTVLTCRGTDTTINNQPSTINNPQSTIHNHRLPAAVLSFASLRGQNDPPSLIRRRYLPSTNSVDEKSTLLSRSSGQVNLTAHLYELFRLFAHADR